jgi:hypothetical protein
MTAIDQSARAQIYASLQGVWRQGDNVYSRAMRAGATVALLLLSANFGCEASLMGDYATRSGNAGATSSGAAQTGARLPGGQSPRWGANNPQPTEPPSTPAVTQGNLPVQATTNPPSTNGTPNATAPWSANNPTVAATTPTPNASQCVDSSTVNNGERALQPPGESCARPCRASWQQCFDRCNNGQDRGCVAQCDEPYRDCMRGCF